MRVTREWDHDDATNELLDAVANTLQDESGLDVRVFSDDHGVVQLRLNGRTFNLVLEEVL
jgi:hypothetical protein